MMIALDGHQVYAKTELGRQAIARRNTDLSRAARTVLLLVDGLTSVAKFGPLLAAARASEETLIELEQMGLIAAANSEPAANERTKPLAAPSAPVSEAEHFERLYALMTEVSASFLGLRGYMFQLKIERSANATELKELQNGLLAAIASRHGKDIARQIQHRIDLLD